MLRPRAFGMVTALSVVGLIFSALAAPAARAQGDQALPKANIADAKKIQELFLKYAAFWRSDEVDAKEAIKQDAALEELAKEIKKFETDKKCGTVLADDVTWVKHLAAAYTERIKNGKDKSPSGKGTIKDESIEVKTSGDVIRYDFAFSLPNAYTPDKAWPVLICLPDGDNEKDATKPAITGKAYLTGVWDDGKESKELRENFILLAPTLHPKTPEGAAKSERGKKLTQKSVAAFDAIQTSQIFRPLVEMRKRFNCDPSKVYIEGVGRGAQLAFGYAALYGANTFAGVVLRNAQPADIGLIASLRDRPVLFLYREGGPCDTGDAKKFFEDMKTIAAKESVKSLTFIAKPPLEKVLPKDMGNQLVDAMKDSNKDVWDFLSKQSLAAYPTTVRFVTNNRAFNRCAWFKIYNVDIAGSGKADILVEVDRATNSIRATTQNVGGVTFFLNDSILDLDKPVTVYFNGAAQPAAEKKVVREMSTMLKDMKVAALTPLRILTAVLQVDIPAATSQPSGEGAVDGEKK